MGFWRSMITGADNQSVDYGRVISLVIVLVWVIGALVFLGLAVGDFLRTNKFEAKDFAFAFASLIATGGSVITFSGAGLALKAGTEPKPGGNQQ